MAKFIVTREASADIDEILAYIEIDNFDAASSFYDRLLNVFRMLADNPNAGRLRNDLQDGLRYFPERSYLIFYRQWADKIAIVRVLHSARYLDEIFS
jgi:toxin ParE1/3/4